jgi:hypothetical protein
MAWEGISMSEYVPLVRAVNAGLSRAYLLTAGRK